MMNSTKTYEKRITISSPNGDLDYRLVSDLRHSSSMACEI